VRDIITIESKTLRLCLVIAKSESHCNKEDDIALAGLKAIQPGLVMAELNRMPQLKGRQHHVRIKGPLEWLHIGRIKRWSRLNGRHCCGQIKGCLTWPHRDKIEEVIAVEWKTSPYPNRRLPNFTTSCSNQRGRCRGSTRPPTRLRHG